MHDISIDFGTPGGIGLKAMNPEAPPHIPALEGRYFLVVTGEMRFQTADEILTTCPGTSTSDSPVIGIANLP